MKFSKYVLVFLLGSLLACDSDDSRNSEVPSVVLNSFKIKFPEAVDISWEKREKTHEVDFEIRQKDHSAQFNATGEVVKLKHEISLAEVPTEVLSSLQRNFEKKDFKDPEKLLVGPETYFQLEIDQFLLDEKVVLDENGKISRKISYWD